MHPLLADAILSDRNVACVLTDQSFRVVEISDDNHLLDATRRAGNLGSLFELLPELEGSEEPLQDVMDGRIERWQIDWVNRSMHAGGASYLRLTTLPYVDAAGVRAGLLQVVEDVTDLGRTQQSLMQSRNELRLAQQALANRNLELAAANVELRRLAEVKSMFVSIVAHELRNPLSVIKAYADTLLDDASGGLEPRQRESLEIIQRTADRLNDLTGNLLDVTRLETGHMELVLQPLDLGLLLRVVVREQRGAFAAAQQDLVVSIEPDLPPALCDELRIIQVFRNLLSNAHKYTPCHGRVDITLGLDEAANELEVRVADSGLGIPPDDQPKLFDRFFRASNAAETGAGGTGLGLYISRSLVELHGGRIWFESEPGCGTTFFVAFPAVDLDSEQDGDETSSPG